MKDGTELSVSMKMRKRRSEAFLIAAQRAFLWFEKVRGVHSLRTESCTAFLQSPRHLLLSFKGPMERLWDGGRTLLNMFPKLRS